MSLKDTISGARQEVLDAQAGRKDSDQRGSAKEAEDEQPKEGFTKRSVARGKPVREAAQGVRVVSAAEVRSGKKSTAGKRESEMTKEERKEARRVRRDSQDRRTLASNALLKSQKSYSRSYRMFLILMAIGMAAAVASWVVTTVNPEAAQNPLSPIGMVSVVFLALAYAAIIYAFVYDWRHVRPLRKAADQEVASMSDRRVEQVLKEDSDRAAREQMERAQAKAAKRARKSSGKSGKGE